MYKYNLSAFGLSTNTLGKGNDGNISYFLESKPAKFGRDQITDCQILRFGFQIEKLPILVK